MNNDNIGKIIGIYEVCNICEERANDGHLKYHVRCAHCGFETDMRLSDIKKPKVCQHLNLCGNYISNSYIWKNKRIKKIFNKMVERCYSDKSKNYRYYGAKGIHICDEWLNNPILFEEWSLQNGYKDNLTIDRIDSNKDYCPENCRWIPLEENVRRAGRVTWIEIDGKNMTGRQWADYLQIGTNTINTAIREHGIDKAKELILAMLKDPPSTKHRKSNQTWFHTYGIQV